MPWLLLFLAFGAFAVAFKTTSMLVMAICLLLAFVLSLIAVMQLLAARVDGSTRSEALMLDPLELRRLRDEAEARKLAASQAAAPGESVSPGDRPAMQASQEPQGRAVF